MVHATGVTTRVARVRDMEVTIREFSFFIA
jgi:hypothetical protein